MQYKDILLGHEARLRIKSGIDKAASAVKPTLGAVGMTAMIDYLGLDPVESDDGVTILKNLEFKDAYENLGLKKLRKAAIRTSIEGGDGTATTTVLTQALVAEAFKEIESDSSKIREVRERLQTGLQEVLTELTKIKREVSMDDIESIAAISSLDPEVATIIAEIIKEVGIHGIVTVEKGSKIGYSKEVVKGMRFDRGLLSQYFINDFENEQCVLENPYIVLIDRRVSLGDQVKSIMNAIEQTGNKSVLIIADDVDGLALASLIQNSKSVTTVNAQGQQKQGTYDIACVRNPYNATQSKDFLKDLAVLTGATVISEEAGMRLDTADISVCGRAEKVIVTKDKCTIMAGQSSDALEARINAIESDIDSTTSDYTKLMLKDRLASLTGGIGVIRVGTYTDTDFHTKKQKFDNAVNATQAALQEGIVAGGGTALYNVSKIITEPMFISVLVAPFNQMSINANFIDSNMPDGDIGVDFKKKQYCNMFDNGIIDPFRVIRLALESATAIATSLVSVEPVITVNEDTKSTE